MSKPLHQALFGSVRGRLTLLVVAVIAPAALMAGGLMLQTFLKERRAVEDQLRATARSLSLLVDQQMAERVALLRGLSTSPFLQNGDLAKFYLQAKKIEGSRDEWIVLRDPEGQQLVNTLRPWGTKLPLVHVSPEFIQAAKAGRPYVSNLLTGPVSGRKVYIVVVPIFHDGALRYTLHFVEGAAIPSTTLVQQGVPSRLVATVVDRAGTIVDRSRLRENLVGTKISSDIAAALSQDSKEILNSSSTEGPVLVAVTRSAFSGWGISVAAPRTTLYGSVRRLFFVALVVSLAVLLVLSFLALWVAKGVVRALEGLVHDSTAIGRGETLVQSNVGLRETDVVRSALRDNSLKLASREHDLRNLKETLEARVVARTRELAEVNRELDNFARIASHDLKEPLRLMTAYAQILRTEYREKLDDTGRMYLERIEAAAERQRALVGDILSYSRDTTPGNATVSVDLNEMVKAVLADLEVRLKETRGSVISDTLAGVKGDPIQIHQLLLNLIGNGLKFHRKDVPPIVKVSTQLERGGVRLTVEDNGIGFDLKYSDRIFSPFERLHSGKAYEGTGMGLAIVRRIAERHSGSVKAWSCIGQGSRFEVWVPERSA